VHTIVDDIELMHLHIDALFTHDVRGRLVAVNESFGRAHAPRLFFGRTREGRVLRVRSDVSDAAAEELAELAAAEPVLVEPPQRPRCAAALCAVLARSAPVERIWAGPAYCIDLDALADAPDAVAIDSDGSALMQSLQAWHGEVAARQPFVVAADGGRGVAVCCSVRITPRAHEAGVETLPESRRRGFATQAVAGWARAVAASGALPLYSTSWDNVASLAIARRLRMHCFGTDFHAM
jgi:GNAT superfamily N-acetyltransferase